MSHFATAIKTAESTGKRDAKAAAVAGFGHEEKRLVFECYNPFRVFNVKKFDAPKQYAQVDHQTFAPFFALLDALHNRELTGNIAKHELTRVMSMYTEETAHYLERVLKKDLKCGMSGETFEKIYPDLQIPRFDLMLAAKIDEIAEETENSRREKKIVLTKEILFKKYGLDLDKGILAESKYDGNRVVAFVTNGHVEYLARSGKDSDHLIGVFDADLVAMEKQVGQPIVVDGEWLASSFSETMKAKGAKNEKKGLTFWAFDMMTRDQWDAQNCPIKQLERSSSLEKLLAEVGATTVKKSKYRICKSIQELRDFYAEVLAEGINPDGTLNGLGEGLIVKNPEGVYEWDRSKFWFKWKPVIDLDLKLVGFEYGNKGTRLQNTVGRLILEGTDENGRKIRARCGSGLNDKDRAYFLANMNILLGSTIQIEAQELTLAQNSDVYSARFPVFIRIRTDK